MIKIGYINIKDYKTYYRIVGAEFEKTPLLVLHGGPGSTHNSLELLDEIAEKDKRPIIYYDQVGCGESSFLEDPTRYGLPLWLDELDNLIKALGIKKVNLLGHSWGGMLLISYLIDYKPNFVEHAILSSTLSSASLWKEETHRLIKMMGKRYEDSLLKSKDYDLHIKEMIEYNRLYICDSFFPATSSTPECLTRDRKADKNVYQVWGPSEFDSTGPLKDFDYTSKLKHIKCPVLILSGTNDESTPLINKVMFDNITANKKWVLLKNARHMTYYDAHKQYIKEVIKFLNS